MAKFSAMILAAGLLLAGAQNGRAANLDELSKFLGFIEGFQHLYEFCQAEFPQLPAAQVQYARTHIWERRALILSGLDEKTRDKIAQDAQGKKKQMLAGIMRYIQEKMNNRPLKDLCKEGFFSGVADSEQKSDAKEIAAIQQAKK
jgi:hypothetical protein